MTETKNVYVDPHHFILNFHEELKTKFIDPLRDHYDAEILQELDMMYESCVKHTKSQNDLIGYAYVFSTMMNHIGETKVAEILDSIGGTLICSRKMFAAYSIGCHRESEEDNNAIKVSILGLFYLMLRDLYKRFRHWVDKTPYKSDTRIQW